MTIELIAALFNEDRDNMPINYDKAPDMTQGVLDLRAEFENEVPRLFDADSRTVSEYLKQGG